MTILCLLILPFVYFIPFIGGPLNVGSLVSVEQCCPNLASAISICYILACVSVRPLVSF